MSVRDLGWIDAAAAAAAVVVVVVVVVVSNGEVNLPSV